VGEPVNLFHVVGLTLVLGMGMDYTLFLKTGNARPSTMLAVLLAAATTECAFGLLGFSRVRALHAFGLTVAIGTLLTFLLAPMVVTREQRPDAGA
jgi:predicted exporter